MAAISRQSLTGLLCAKILVTCCSLVKQPLFAVFIIADMFYKDLTVKKTLLYAAMLRLPANQSMEEVCGLTFKKKLNSRNLLEYNK